MPLLNALSCNTNLTRLCVLGNSELQKDTILHLTLPKLGNQVCTLYSSSCIPFALLSLFPSIFCQCCDVCIYSYLDTETISN